MRIVTSSRLSLVLPSLPDENPEFLQYLQACAEQASEPLNLFHKLLARADKMAMPVTDRHSLVFYLLSGEVQTSPPVAALRALADGLQPADEAYWLCADPVHLHPDLDHLLLFSGESFSPTPAQARQLVEELNQLFREDALEFIVGTHEHWYLRCRQAPDVSFTPLDKVLARNILHFLPVGPEQATWRRYLNEMQMQMTASEVNRQRAESAMAEVNSVWCWGGGKLPKWSPEYGSSAFSRVYTQQAFSRGLARYMRVEVGDVPGSAGECVLDDTEQLLEFAELAERDDPQAFMRFLSGFERDYLQVLCSDMKQGKLDELVIYFAGQRFCLNRKTMRRWWRRPRQLTELLA
ncbi:hypothetical protein [Sulfuriflexus mobilis]|uniref:hypothetical protein n=1 Tax=Sulfuriflexus mobilis TaxID=1811807 RepID=UPI000F84CAA4|nr:hypothetical protein [Sulfuriflexus mobilis]